MLSVTSRSQKNQPKARLDLLAELIVAILNGDSAFRYDRHRMNRRAILVFVKRLQRADQAMKQAELSGVESEYEPPIEVLRAFWSANRLLARYTVTPSIEATIRDAEHGLKPEGRFGRLAWHRSGPEPFFPEFPRILSVYELAQAEKLSRLKQCGNCNRWLYAKFSHQRFCGDECKEKFHRSDPEDKERRREWARNNYRLHKTKNVK